MLRDLSPVESEVQSQDGRWFMMRLRPYRTVEDRIEGVVLTFVDISSRRETERQLVESQQRYQTLFNSIDEGFAVLKVIFSPADTATDFRFIEVNEAFSRQTGLEDAVGQTAGKLIPGLEAQWLETYERIVRNREPERFEAPAVSLGRYYEAYAFPVGPTHESRIGVLFRDIKDRKEAEEQWLLLTRELSHRVKNTLAVVQALARQPGAPEMTLQQYRDRFIARIQALGRAHDQLLQTNWQSADLEMLIKSTLSAYSCGDNIDQETGGPQLQLTPKQGLSLALVLHELATNAAKYVALATENGMLSVSWEIAQVERGNIVQVLWQERDGPEVEKTASAGFGMKLIERACIYELGGSVELRFAPEGLSAMIKFPIPVDRTLSER